MTHTHSEQRLDLQMVARGLAPSRNQAQDLIRRGKVHVAGVPATKPGMPVTGDTAIDVDCGEVRHVSRGGMKLIAALDAFDLSPERLVALDVGASTGGFTEVLLERGARLVYAVDVGHGQLDKRLRADARVINLERRDARTLTSSDLPEAPGIITADVSFISLTQALGPALGLTAPGALLIALIKPQFEAGRAAVGKGGIVRDPADRQRAVDRVLTWLADRTGWRILGIIASPITGGAGNQEFLLAARHDG